MAALTADAADIVATGDGALTLHPYLARDSATANDYRHAQKNITSGPVVPVTLDGPGDGYRLAGTKATTVVTVSG